MFAKYIQNNYGTATPKLLTFLCVTHNFSWLLSQKMWQPVTLKVRFLPYTKGQYVQQFRVERHSHSGGFARSVRRHSHSMTSTLGDIDLHHRCSLFDAG